MVRTTVSVTKLLTHCLLLILLLLRWGVAISGNVVVERSWVEDPSGRMTHEQAMAAPQQPLTGPYFGQGFSASAFWIRLRIDPTGLPTGKPEDPMVIRLRPIFIDEFELHDPLSPKGQPRYTGDRHAWSEDEYQSLNNNFLIPLGHAPRDVWLRLKTHSATLSSIEVLELKSAQSKDWAQVIWGALYLAVLLICTGWGLLSWVASREKLVLRYVVREVFMLGFAVVLLGGWRMWGSQWLPPEWIDEAGNVVFCTFGLLLIWFDIHLFREFQPKPYLTKALHVMFVAFALAVVLALAGQPRLALRIHSITVVVSTVLVFVTALTIRMGTDGDKTSSPLIPKWLLVGTYLFLLLLGGSNRLAATGVLPGTYDTFDLILLYPLAGSLLMMVVLQLRASGLHKAQQAAQMQVQLAEQLAQDERHRREEQGQFLSMLTHELKTPLAVVRISLDDSPLAQPQRQRINRALSNLTGIIDRCVVNDQLENHKITPQLKPCHLQQWVAECARNSRDPTRVKVSESKETIVQTDSGLLAICMANLIDNALKYSPPESWIDVRTQFDPMGVTITVCNAIGLAGAPDPQQLYTKYYRSRGALSKSGSGLGLHLTRNLVQLLGARLTHSANDTHVEFSLWLPA